MTRRVFTSAGFFILAIMEYTGKEGNMPIISGEVTTTAELEFEVFCGKCGEGLCNQSETGNTPRRGAPFVRVQPCEVCLDRAKDEGRSNGYDDGYDKGFSEGRSEGFDVGYENAKNDYEVTA